MLSGVVESCGSRRVLARVRERRVSRSLGDPDERAFCKAAGALGVDPYGVSEEDALFIEEAAGLLSGEALLEFLAGVGRGAGRTRGAPS